MTLGEFVTKKHNEGFQFLTLDTARAAYAEAGVCTHNSTIGGICDECGHVWPFTFITFRRSDTMQEANHG